MIAATERGGFYCQIEEGELKYRYTAIYSVRGISLAATDPERNLLGADHGLSAILTNQTDSHTFEGDRSFAAGYLMLTGLFHPDVAADEFRRRIDMEVEDRRNARQKKFGSSPFLVIIAEGETPSATPVTEREFEDFIVYVDGPKSGEIRTQNLHKVTALLNSLAAEAEGIVGIRKVSDSVVYFRDKDAKPVYSYAFTAGSATAYISRPLASERAEAIGETYLLYSADSALERIQRLIVTSFEAEDDPLRSFLAAWSAFEIFINKVFGTYESLFFESLVKAEDPQSRGRYLTRIREVMKDKYRLTEKFAVVSLYLSPDSSDDDATTVRQVKKIRDGLAHGETVDEAMLPVESVRSLTSKYLRLHLKHQDKRTAAS